ncbi:transcription factor [Fusarium longipes]|uniref:Transcription factor n=1 Tax=Fusarium longipes TaxID=694270 RepID=A0A395T5E0_9HYPO|nr:transcription factor [Fusarium longipes]
MSGSKTVAFFGASTGIGLSALKETLAAGHHCIALCRVPPKLETLHTEYPNLLRIVEGNAHDSKAVSSCLVKDDGSLVDEILFSIGGKPVPLKMTIDDPTVCQVGINVVLESITQLRSKGATGKPLVIALSTTGTSSFGRDYPFALSLIYGVFLKVPRDDKIAMEEKLAASGEDFCVVRASLLVNGKSETAIRVGIEDPKTGRQSQEIGYTISREDAGRWIAKNLILQRNGEYVNKIASITY